MRTGRAYPAAVIATSMVALAMAGSAAAEPRVVSAGFDRPTVTGSETHLAVTAIDRGAPVNGISVTSGNPAQAVALSACRPPGSSGRAPRGPFAPGARSVLRVPLRFSRTGAQLVVAKVESGGCAAPKGSVYQPITVTPTPPRERPVSPVIGRPVTDPGLLPMGPGFPGGIDLPAVGARSSAVAAQGLTRALSRCRGADRGVGGDVRSRRAGRQSLLCAVNRARRWYGRRGLRSNRRLLHAATAHSTSMVKGRYFSHVTPDGVVLVQRLQRVRYLPARRWLVGENLASARGRDGTPRAIVLAWLNSPPHRANLLDPVFREIGIGLVPGQPTGAAYGVTFTANFGVRK